MRLVHLSDLHFGAIDPLLPERLRAAILTASPDLVVISGDLTMRGKEGQFREAKAFLDSLPVPQIVVPGNHDVQGSWDFWERFLHPFRNYKKVVSENLEPTWRMPGMVVIGANSARPAGWNLDWSRGQLSRSQMTRLAGSFKDAEENALRVLVIHHPPASPPTGTARHLLGRLKQFTDAVTQAGVDLILCGHFHRSYCHVLLLPGHDKESSCILSSVSTALSHRLKGEPNGFHLIEGNLSALTVQDFAWNGKDFCAGRKWSFESERGSLRTWRVMNEIPSDAAKDTPNL